MNIDIDYEFEIHEVNSHDVFRVNSAHRAQNLITVGSLERLSKVLTGAKNHGKLPNGEKVESGDTLWVEREYVWGKE